MQGTMPGARRRGRPRTAWMDNIKTWTGLRGRVNQNDRGQGQMEKVRPWCGQPSDEGRLKNRTRWWTTVIDFKRKNKSVTFKTQYTIQNFCDICYQFSQQPKKWHHAALCVATLRYMQVRESNRKVISMVNPTPSTADAGPALAAAWEASVAGHRAMIPASASAVYPATSAWDPGPRPMVGSRSRRVSRPSVASSLHGSLTTRYLELSCASSVVAPLPAAAEHPAVTVSCLFTSQLKLIHSKLTFYWFLGSTEHDILTLCQSVSLSVTRLCCANTVERIEVLFGIEILGDNELDAAFAKLLWPLFIVHKTNI